MIFIAVSCTILMMDPDFLEMLGINIKPFFEAFNGRPYLPPRVVMKDITSSFTCSEI